MGMPTALRQVLQHERIVVAPVCCDPLSARVVESLGFKAAYLGGFALGAVTCLTEPLTNMSEMAEHAQRMARRINIPLIIDGNAGFGEPIHTRRAVREFEWAGVAGTHIEDQYYPKRAHYHKGIEPIISTEEMVMKLRAEAITAPLVAVQALKRAYGQLARDGRMSLDQMEMRAMRQEIEDLIGLEEYYKIEAETVERA